MELLSRVPQDIWTFIFNLLPDNKNIRLVCRGFRQLQPEVRHSCVDHQCFETKISLLIRFAGGIPSDQRDFQYDIISATCCCGKKINVRLAGSRIIFDGWDHCDQFSPMLKIIDKIDPNARVLDESIKIIDDYNIIDGWTYLYMSDDTESNEICLPNCRQFCQKYHQTKWWPKKIADNIFMKPRSPKPYRYRKIYCGYCQQYFTRCRKN